MAESYKGVSARGAEASGRCGGQADRDVPGGRGARSAENLPETVRVCDQLLLCGTAYAGRNQCGDAGEITWGDLL